MSTEALKFFVPFDIKKTDDEKRLVFGYASTESIDSQGEIIEKGAIEGALDDYMKYANIREMHTRSAVGITKEATMDNKGLYICAKIVDPTAWVKVKEGVYKGFSVGGGATKKINKVIKSMRMNEISLVDRPSNPDAMIELWKSAGPGDLFEEKTSEEKANSEKTEKVDNVKKVATGTSISKSYYNMVSLTRMIYDLNDLKSNIENEQAIEEDNDSVLPGKVKDAIFVLIGLFESMVSEEMSEIKAGTEAPEFADALALMAKNQGLEKSGARNNKMDKGSIQMIHDMAGGLGAMCKQDSPTKIKQAGEDAGDIQKTNSSSIINQEEVMDAKDMEAIQKMFTTTVEPIVASVKTLEDKMKTEIETTVQKVDGLTKENDALKAKIKQLEELPADDGKGIQKIAGAIGKEGDIGKMASEDAIKKAQAQEEKISSLIQKKFNGDPRADEALKEEAVSMIKKAHQNPKNISDRFDVVREATVAKV